MKQWRVIRMGLFWPPWYDGRPYGWHLSFTPTFTGEPSSWATFTGNFQLWIGPFAITRSSRV